MGVGAEILDNNNIKPGLKTQTRFLGLTESTPVEIKSAGLLPVSSCPSPSKCCHLRETHRSWIKVTFGKRCQYLRQCAPEMSNYTLVNVSHWAPPSPFTFDFPLRWGQFLKIWEREINTCVKEWTCLLIYVCIILYASMNNHLEEVSIFSVIVGLCEVKVTDTCG